MDTTRSAQNLNASLNPNARVQLLTFRIQGQEYAIKVANVVQVVRMVGVTRAPKAPDYVEGLMNLHGQVIPVVNLARLFGLEEHAVDLETQLLIASAKNHTAAFIVDIVSEVLVLSREQIEQPDDIVQALEYLYGVGMVDDRLVLIIDLDALFDDISPVVNTASKLEEVVA
jgi:purine-binding chemotaxis protein CheW